MQEAADTGGMNRKAASASAADSRCSVMLGSRATSPSTEQPMIPADQMRPVTPHLARRNAAAQALAAAHLITLDTATRSAAATWRVVSPASSRAIASSRKSIEYGFDMLPDLQRSAR